MRKIVYLFAFFASIAWTGVFADEHMQEGGSAGHLYLGLGVSSLALDNDRVPGVPTSSPSHASIMGTAYVGYQFSDLWAVDLTLGTDLDGEVDTDDFAINGYRFFGSRHWKPFISAGFSSIGIDEAPDDSTEQLQAGVGLSGYLNENVELRFRYQHLFTISGDSFQDREFGAALLWHFLKPKAAAAAEPAAAPVAAPVPVVAPAKKEVVDRYELVVEFDFDKSNIRSVYEPQFREIAGILEEDADITMNIEGHTDSIGTEEYNIGLSQRRANSVKQKFVDDYGIAAQRITTEGFGESQPIASNDTAAGRQKNRRAISVILRTRVVNE